jgi:hypothetical protein
MTPLQTFIRDRKHLVWYVVDVTNLDEASVVEHVLNYGTWADVQALCSLLGVEHTAQVFTAHALGSRTNYRKNIARYFTRYFKAHIQTQRQTA